MAVFVRTAVVHAVVKMYRAQAVQTDHMVKFLQDTIQISRNIISSIPDMTGIQTDAKLIGQLYTVNNRAQFLKASSHLTTFPAIVSRRTVVVCSGVSTSLSASAIHSIPASAPVRHGNPDENCSNSPACTPSGADRPRSSP